MSDTPDILHEEDVRAVIDDQVRIGFNGESLVILTLGEETVLSNTYDHVELQNIINSLAETINLLINRLAEVGILTIWGS